MAQSSQLDNAALMQIGHSHNDTGSRLASAHCAYLLDLLGISTTLEAAAIIRHLRGAVLRCNLSPGGRKALALSHPPRPPLLPMAP